jgi:hypothetical protein
MLKMNFTQWFKSFCFGFTCPHIEKKKDTVYLQNKIKTCISVNLAFKNCREIKNGLSRDTGNKKTQHGKLKNMSNWGQSPLGEPRCKLCKLCLFSMREVENGRIKVSVCKDFT